ncbi:uncharacterized transcriptional regulatory protein C3C7.04 [Trichoderma asperellum]|uniref:Uncharacterized transcriptional regulatory protein C3C7.04 n=1 Tax=Trichoderma asperellum TaxID=101201 RepID=A0A6V8QX57_TRIAP|nr:uncharacterized transcriptional regulatory protein C3C7.04 [Trichoderma asperellum]
MAASLAAASFPTPSMSTSSGDTGRGSQVYTQPQPQPQPQPYAQPQPSSRHAEPPSSTSTQEPQQKQKQQQQQQQQQRPAKRRRIGYACNLCRTKKNRYIENLRARNRGNTIAAATTPTAGGGGGTTTGKASASTGRIPKALAARRSIAEASGVGGESLAESSPSTVVFEELLGIGAGIGDGSGSSDLFELPQRSLADRLVASYFKHRHPLNPYLHEGTFRQRYARLWLSKDVGGEEAAPNNLAWLGLVNMVFAFGSEHAQTRHPYHGSPGSSASAKPDRARFFKRAKMLAFSSILQAKIELVQALLLMSHYLHGSLELNHCWTVIGLAIRTAQELGLYLDSTDFTNDIVEQEIRKRVWWGCFVIDRLVSIKVGRPPTIHDIPAIRVGLPLAVDDEFLNEASNYTQPSNIPSKIEFFNHIVTQCRLLAKVLDTLYDNTPSSSGSGGGSSSSSSAGRETRVRIKVDLPDLLAMSIQLDGELVVWQNLLPPHLRTDSDVPGWHFERQRNVLLMRFLHIRLLIHRQTLLYYILRRIPDPFQADLAHLCIRRCVMAAYDAIFQVHLLTQKNLLSSSWHNSHYVFTALSVLLVYQHLDPHSRSKVDIPQSSDIDNVIGHGLEHLQRVGGDIHPLASRYVRSFQQLQTRLQAIGTLSANAPLLAVRGKQQLSVREDGGSNFRQAHTASSATDSDQSSSVGHQAGSATGGSSNKGPVNMPDQSQENNEVSYYGDAYQEQYNDRNVEYGDDGFMWAGFDDEFAVIQSALLDSSGWGSGFLDPWAQ